MTDMNSIADRVRHARESIGITQGKLAKGVGVSRAAISQIENGMTKYPRPETLVRIARYLGTSIEWLVLGESEKSSENNGLYINVPLLVTPDGNPVQAYVDQVANQPDVMLHTSLVSRLCTSVDSARLVVASKSSFRPVFNQGATLLIDTDQREPDATMRLFAMWRKESAGIEIGIVGTDGDHIRILELHAGYDAKGKYPEYNDSRENFERVFALAGRVVWICTTV